MKRAISGLAAFLLLVTVAQAGVTNILNDGSLTGPGTVQALIVDKGQLTGSLAMDGPAAEDTAQVFLESANVVLSSDLVLTDGGVISAGSIVNSYIVHFDPVGNASDPIWEAKGTITFGGEVLGLIYAKNDTGTYSLITDSDDSVGIGGSNYHTNTYHRKFEMPQSPYGDVAQFTGNTATINMFTNSSMDEVRIITQGIPAPGAIFLALLGTPIIGYLRRRSML